MYGLLGAMLGAGLAGGFLYWAEVVPKRGIEQMERETLAALTRNYEEMFEARYQAGYEAGLVQGMAEQRELTRASHVVRGQKAAQTRKQRQEAA